MDQVEAGVIDETPEQITFGGFNLVTEIVPGMNGRDQHIAGLLDACNGLLHRVQATIVRLDEIDTRLLGICGPWRRHVAGWHRERDDNRPPLSRYGQDRR